MNPQSLLNNLRPEHTDIAFKEGSVFMWSPSEGTVYYPASDLSSEDAAYSILHELGHALSGHEAYTTDVDLLKLELEAWQKARSISTKYEVTIPEDHIEDCLDSYRDWLHRRSLCPNCSIAGLQSAQSLQYECINCSESWSVPADQTCATRRVRT